jgi:hypothetical protein
MRGVLYLLSALSVIALAAWAYRENHRTQQAARELRDMQSEIANLREAITVHRAEWAYLNRPERLRELADLNIDRLRLVPLSAAHFALIDQIAYPPAPSTAALAEGEFDLEGVTQTMETHP